MIPKFAEKNETSLIGTKSSCDNPTSNRTASPSRDVTMKK